MVRKKKSFLRKGGSSVNYEADKGIQLLTKGSPLQLADRSHDGCGLEMKRGETKLSLIGDL